MAVLYLIEQGSLLRKELKRLVVEKDGKVLLEVPEFKVDRVIIMGNIQITTQAMKFLLASGIETAFLTTRGRLLGKLTPVESKNVELRMLQYKRYHDERFRLSLAKCVVRGKIKNSRALLQKYRRNHPEVPFEESIRELEKLISELPRKEKVSSVFGLEGRASAIYFSCFGRMFRKELQFKKRTRHPPLDPVNALLSFGYTIITQEMLSVVSSLGFDPYIGFLHGIEYGRPSLALDLIEEFRAPIIDRLILEIINKGIISSGDFEKKENSIYLKDSSRRKFFQQYEKRMKDTFLLPGREEGANYRRIFFIQAQKFARVLKEGGLYKTFTIR